MPGAVSPWRASSRAEAKSESCAATYDTAAAAASGVAKSTFSHAASTVSPAIASRQPNAEPGMNARVASSKPRASSARWAAARSRRAKRSRAPHPAKARISTRIATAPPPPPPPPANQGGPPTRPEARRDGDDRPYRERHDAGQIKGRLPTAIEHEPLLPRAVWLNGGGGGHPRPGLCARATACVDAGSHFAQCVPARNGRANSAGKFELAFPGHALERLIRIFDAILVIGAVGGEQLHHLIGAVSDHVTNRTRGEVDALADLKLVFLQQRGSPALERYGLLVLSGVPPIAVEYSSQIYKLPRKFRFSFGIGFHAGYGIIV